MNYELAVNLGNSMTTAFLQKGFYESGLPTAHVHKHSYTEFHIVLGGSVSFYIDGAVYELDSGNIIAIPAGLLHERISFDDGAMHTAFQLQKPVQSVKICSKPEEMLRLLFGEIKHCVNSDDYTDIAALISLICADVYSEVRVSAQRVKNNSFIIGEFFSNNYSSDITLSSLAKELHLSEKQTERLVEKCMGCSFKKALTAVRMNMAEYLIKEAKLSLTEIAEYVGYRSYSGFWKAYQKHKAESNKTDPTP